VARRSRSNKINPEGEEVKGRQRRGGEVLQMQSPLKLMKSKTKDIMEMKQKF